MFGVIVLRGFPGRFMNSRFVSVILTAGCLSLRAFGFSPEAVSVRQAVTNGVEVRWFETWMPAEDGARLYTYGTAPKEGVRCPQFRIRHPKVAKNQVFGDGSELILPVCDPK